jgi:fatty acid desaturase
MAGSTSQLRKRLPEKENPTRWASGQVFFLIGVYGFKYAAWLLVLRLSVFVFVQSSQPIFVVVTALGLGLFFLLLFLILILEFLI